MTTFLFPHGLRTLALGFALVLLAGGSSGCHCAFEKEWQAAHDCPIPCDQLAGLWEGTWESEETGHHGSLRAIVTSCGNGHYNAYYCGTFAVIIPFTYEANHPATQGNGCTCFTGEADLGCFGSFSCNGWANGSQFVANYASEKDKGVFRMCRVTPEP
jgi:hypothetical protein